MPQRCALGGMKLAHVIAVFGLLLAAPTAAQQAGRAQDGFYSGQTSGQSNGQMNERVDGRATRSEGESPSAGDVAKRNQQIQRSGSPNDAEALDHVVRPDFNSGR